MEKLELLYTAPNEWCSHYEGSSKNKIELSYDPAISPPGHISKRIEIGISEILALPWSLQPITAARVEAN